MSVLDRLHDLDFKPTGEMGQPHVAYAKRYYDPAADAHYRMEAHLARGTGIDRATIVNVVITVTAVIPPTADAVELLPTIIRADFEALLASQSSAPVREAAPVHTETCAVHGGPTSDYLIVATPAGPRPAVIVCRQCYGEM